VTGSTDTTLTMIASLSATFHSAIYGRRPGGSLVEPEHVRAGLG
jgi:hypothetical protein